MAFRDTDLAEMLTHLGAVSATYSGGTIQVILNTPPSDETFGAGGDVDVQEARPYVVCRTADVPTAKVGDTMVIAGVTWYFNDVRPDGVGITRIDISKDL